MQGGARREAVHRGAVAQSTPRWGYTLERRRARRNSSPRTCRRCCRNTFWWMWRYVPLYPSSAPSPVRERAGCETTEKHGLRTVVGYPAALCTCGYTLCALPCACAAIPSVLSHVRVWQCAQSRALLTCTVAACPTLTPTSCPHCWGAADTGERLGATSGGWGRSGGGVSRHHGSTGVMFDIRRRRTAGHRRAVLRMAPHQRRRASPTFPAIRATPLHWPSCEG